MPNTQNSGISYWAFRANPEYFSIEEAVAEAIREQKEDTWLVRDRKVRAGDRAIIWKTKGTESHTGIVALAEVLTDPKPMKDPNTKHWVNQSVANEVANRVIIRYLVSPNLPLWEGKTHVKAIEERKLSIQQRYSQGSAFRVESHQWDDIMKAIGGWPTPEIVDAEFAIAEVAGKKRSGQGFRIGVAERQAIEQYAMQVAIAHYEEQGWSVEDVSATCSYDLMCKRNGGEELHVEVKGTTSDGKQILLTANEVEHARYRYPHVALFVLTNIKIERTSTGEIRPSGGEKLPIDQWNVDEGVLTPLAYAYIVPKRDIIEEVK